MLFNEYFLKIKIKRCWKEKEKRNKVITITQYKTSRELKEKPTSSIAKKRHGNKKLWIQSK